MEKGIGGHYEYDEETRQWIKVSDSCPTNPEPIWCPDGGYFDKALNRKFNSKTEKRKYMKEKGLRMDGSETKKVRGPEGGIGRTYYSFEGKTKNEKTYKHR